MDDTDTQNTQTRRIAIGIVIALGLAGGTWWYLSHRSTTPEAAAPAAAAETAAPGDTVAEAQPIQHPLEPPAPADAEAPATPVDPDVAARAALDEAFGIGALAEWLNVEQLARRLVATTDNLSRNARTESLRPLRAPTAPFVVERQTVEASTGTERITLAPANAARYEPMVALLARTDMTRAAQLYRGLYPLLQKSYEDLGYPGRYFNDRVVETIDHLLATPEPAGPLLLEQPKVLYRFADADLEARSAGQKLLLRMGVDHARTVKNKLREFRAQIASKE